MPTDDDQRPDPDALLEQVEAEERKAARGKLKIFFGASPGVGKTYAMLQAARQQQTLGVDAVVGLVETHNRSETAGLLDGLERLPLRQMQHQGRSYAEFDLDAALQRRPQLLLVDELAHSNAPGSRHPKRWQDVEELLAEGIDIYTTINVQHLESLNDVVGRITGARVWETVPDHVFDAADEVVLVDLPPDELLARLKAGKVYVPQQAERAMQNFFRKGNLMALRELSLRRTADRVDEDVQAWRKEQSVGMVWPMRESLLVCIRPGSGAERLVRSAARLAVQLDVPWHALYVETPRLQRLPDAERRQALKALQLAQELGAQTANQMADDSVEAIIGYARNNNLGKVLIGREKARPWWPRLRPNLGQRLLARAPDLDIVQLANAGVDGEKPASTPQDKLPIQWRRYGAAVLAVLAVTLLSSALHGILAQVNIVMLYLLATVLVAFRYGRNPAIVGSVLAVLAFDFFFVQPHLTFAVADLQYLLTFAVMLGVAVITAHLTSSLRLQRDAAHGRERRTRLLYQMARDLSAVLSVEQTEEAVRTFVQQGFQAEAVLLPLGMGDKLPPPPQTPQGVQLDMALAQWAIDHAAPAGLSTDTLPLAPVLYLPLKAPMRTRGILAIQPRQASWLPTPEQERLLQAGASLVAIALERLHYIEVAQQALLQMESEQLRNNLLAALSHDLRTPLTALVGLADALTLQQPRLQEPHAGLAQAIREEALRTTALVHNLLDMARLQAGTVKLHKEWQPLEEVVGTALRARAGMLAQHEVRVELPPDLPLVEFDAVLIERVLVNLLENAAKYTLAGSRITMGAHPQGKDMHIRVCDNGAGLPAGMEKRVFDKFTRGQEESAISGVGLGLSIVRAIVEAHKGRVWAERGEGGTGVCFVFTLPLGQPPAMPRELLP
ncbi:MAG: DUF4118 domain-containing protein [Brachymonas sp.]|nr:DUF4118 domain-containing protein [Brachymonas sp.]